MYTCFVIYLFIHLFVQLFIYLFIYSAYIYMCIYMYIYTYIYVCTHVYYACVAVYPSVFSCIQSPGLVSVTLTPIVAKVNAFFFIQSICSFSISGVDWVLATCWLLLVDLTPRLQFDFAFIAANTKGQCNLVNIVNFLSWWTVYQLSDRSGATPCISRYFYIYICSKRNFVRYPVSLGDLWLGEVFCYLEIVWYSDIVLYVFWIHIYIYILFFSRRASIMFRGYIWIFL